MTDKQIIAAYRHVAANPGQSTASLARAIGVKHAQATKIEERLRHFGMLSHGPVRVGRGFAGLYPAVSSRFSPDWS